MVPYGPLVDTGSPYIYDKSLGIEYAGMTLLLLNNSLCNNHCNNNAKTCYMLQNTRTEIEGSEFQENG